jgi:hypothetical protein
MREETPQFRYWFASAGLRMFSREKERGVAQGFYESTREVKGFLRSKNRQIGLPLQVAIVHDLLI